MVIWVGSISYFGAPLPDIGFFFGCCISPFNSAVNSTIFFFKNLFYRWSCLISSCKTYSFSNDEFPSSESIFPLELGLKCEDDKATDFFGLVLLFSIWFSMILNVVLILPISVALTVFLIIIKVWTYFIVLLRKHHQHFSKKQL